MKYYYLKRHKGIFYYLQNSKRKYGYRLYYYDDKYIRHAIVHRNFKVLKSAITGYLRAIIKFGRDIHINTSRGEIVTNAYLSLLNIPFIYGYKLHNTNIRYKQLHLDFYLPSNNIGIEYDGYQHRVPAKDFGGITYFKIEKRRDKNKDKYCKNEGIKLFRIKELKRSYSWAEIFHLVLNTLNKDLGVNISETKLKASLCSFFINQSLYFKYLFNLSQSKHRNYIKQRATGHMEDDEGRTYRIINNRRYYLNFGAKDVFLSYKNGIKDYYSFDKNKYFYSHVTSERFPRFKRFKDIYEAIDYKHTVVNNYLSKSYISCIARKLLNPWALDCLDYKDTTVYQDYHDGFSIQTPLFKYGQNICSPDYLKSNPSKLYICSADEVCNHIKSTKIHSQALDLRGKDLYVLEGNNKFRPIKIRDLILLVKLLYENLSVTERGRAFLLAHTLLGRKIKNQANNIDRKHITELSSLPIAFYPKHYTRWWAALDCANKIFNKSKYLASFRKYEKCK